MPRAICPPSRDPCLCQVPSTLPKNSPLASSHGSNSSISQLTFEIAPFSPSVCTHCRREIKQPLSEGRRARFGLLPSWEYLRSTWGGWAETQVRFTFSRHVQYARFFSHSVTNLPRGLLGGHDGAPPPLAAVPAELCTEVPARVFLSHRAPSFYHRTSY